MGSRQFGSRSGNGHNNTNNNSNIPPLNDYTLEDLKSYKVIGIQFGINPIGDNIIKQVDNENSKEDYSAPPVITINRGFSGPLADSGNKNDCIHCFCFLEVEELDYKDLGIMIEFGEYQYDSQNDFEVKSFYESKKGGLRYYIVKKLWFENYSILARVKCLINKKEILQDIINGISQEHKWRMEFYDRDKQNSEDFVVALLKYLEIQNFQIYKGTIQNIPNKIKEQLKI